MGKKYLYLIIVFSIVTLLFYSITDKRNKDEYISKWFLPTKNSCINNNGTYLKNDKSCNASFENAKKICLASNGFLPSRKDLEEFILSCGGIPNADEKEMMINSDNKDYQQCLNNKGFTSFFYWSSTLSPRYLINSEENARFVWRTVFSFGDILEENEGDTHTSICCKKNQ